MPRRADQRLSDIAEAAKAIVGYVAGMDERAFQGDRKTLDAVLRNLTVIGEAARHVPDDFRERFPSVPWVEMGDMRNVVVHEYFGVDVGILWLTVRRDVPELLAALEPVLAAIASEREARGDTRPDRD